MKAIYLLLFFILLYSCTIHDKKAIKFIKTERYNIRKVGDTVFELDSTTYYNKLGTIDSLITGDINYYYYYNLKGLLIKTEGINHDEPDAVNRAIRRYNDSDSLIYSSIQEHDFTLHIKLKRNNLNQVVEKTFINTENQFIEIDSFGYYRSGKLASITKFNSFKNLYYKKENVYNNNNLLIKEVTYKKTQYDSIHFNEEENTITYTYTKDHKISSIKDYLGGLSTGFRHYTYFYDDRSTLKKIVDKPVGDVSGVTNIRAFDSHGNLILYKVLEEDGHVRYNNEWRYIYDLQNHWIYKKTIAQDTTTSGVKRTIVYY
ncbi:hypothetical protein ACG2LH_02020 [Zhouia sp. PK063]|uniref:hypothetical protein n=1 Tax=Zhouia sp. PK063 TaxID=3373602 RepID=UPI00379ACA13